MREKTPARKCVAIVVSVATLTCTSCAGEASDPGPIPGGVELLYRLRADAEGVEPGLVRSTIRILRNRLTSAMAVHCHLEARGADQVLVQIRRGVGLDIDRLRPLIDARGELEFRLCATDPAKRLRASKGMGVPGYHRQWRGLSRGEFPASGRPRSKWYLIEDRVRLTGSHLADAYVTEQSSEPAVGFRMGEEGAKKLALLTRENMGAPLAILVDGRLVTAPTIRDRIVGVGVISSGFTLTEAENLARILKSDPLPAALKLVSLDGGPPGGHSAGTAEGQGREL